MKNAVLTIRVASKLRKRLEELARREGRSLSQQAGRLIEQGIGGVGKQLVVRSRRRRPRQGWDERFRDLAAQGADRMLWPETPLSSFDETEWGW